MAVEDVRSLLVVCHSPEFRAGLVDVLAEERWKVLHTRTCADGLSQLSRHRFSVVICACKLPDGDWKDVLRQVSSMTLAPRLIVTSRLADEYLWAEVLNLGGYDVLAQPFDQAEVIRVIGSAERASVQRSQNHAVHLAD